MHDFEYEAPTTVADAVKMLAKHNGSARILAGGTDLIDQIRMGRFAPDVVVDIKKVDALHSIDISADGLKLGAVVPCYRIYGNEMICRDYSALADATKIIGGAQIQSRASVGGNLCNSGPAADSTPALIALGAQAVIAGPDETREVPVEKFCTGPGKNVLEPGELLTALVMPARPAHSGSHYLRFIPRNEMDIAVVGAGASVLLDESGKNFVSARIAIGAVAATPLFAEEASELLAGQPVGDEAIEAAMAATRKIATPINDMRGTVEFRKHVTGVLTRRALEKAIERARANTGK
ncbi:Carbon monoxide dehydrogenase medium chain [Symmachiella macrocystis]|uniref:Carbon monoxide dehydrogenase medium chain n=1 Tax=Symmachiella macrocystis TaxID=2527985 RepID=A0A5C6BPD4_9PLAN|nr:xanthine dehydrogenase family protein subunit M [Symmachiella macrocystis]TWU14060.1 Carbon monoxide dehydrogenase medium chain [Symmachiella macrocystis]